MATDMATVVVIGRARYAYVNATAARLAQAAASAYLRRELEMMGLYRGLASLVEERVLSPMAALRLANLELHN